MSHDGRNWARDIGLKGPRGKRQVLKSLGDHANEHWASWPSRKLIGKETDLDPATVSNYLRALVHDGLIVPVPWRNEEGGDAGSGYFLMGAPDAPNFAPVSVAFKDRRYGHSRGYKPSWWSGSKEDESLWGEGHTDVRGAQHPCEGEGNTGVREGVTPVLPLELSREQSEEPSRKSGSPTSRASADAEAGASGTDAWAEADATASVAATAAPRQRSSSTVRIPVQREERSVRRAAAKPKRSTAGQRRDADRHERIEGMPEDRVEDVLTKYAKAMPKGYRWASEMARKDLHLTEDPEYGGNGYDEFLRRVYWWALKFHNKNEDWPEALTWALDDEAVDAAEAKAAVRNGRVSWLSCKAGAEEGVLKDMYAAVTAMDPEARAEMAEDIRMRKPRIWAKSWESAEEQLRPEGFADNTVAVTRLAMQYVLRHYRNSDLEVKRWPAFVVPPSFRPGSEAKAA